MNAFPDYDDAQLIEELIVALRLEQTARAYDLTTEVVRRGLTERAYARAEEYTRQERRRLTGGPREYRHGTRGE